MFGVAGDTLDAMMRASTRRPLTAADVVINVPLASTDHSTGAGPHDLIEEGYYAAEAMREQLLPLAVSEADFEAWRHNARRDDGPSCRRRRSSSRGFVESDASG